MRPWTYSPGTHRRLTNVYDELTSRLGNHDDPLRHRQTRHTDDPGGAEGRQLVGYGGAVGGGGGELCCWT